MKELIVVGYPTTHSALLAGAVLSRQTNELSIADDDVSVLSRGDGDSTTIREPVSLSKSNQSGKDFWKRLSRLLFPPADGDLDLNSIESKLTELGINPTDHDRINAAMPVGTTGVLVLAEKEAADRVSGILSGFQGTITRVHLKTENPRQVLHTMSKTG